MAYHKLPQKENLIGLYKKMSTCEIAKKYGVTQRAVSTKLKRAGIEIRGLQEAQNLKANHITISHDIKNLIEGNLLGDGSIHYAPNKKSFCYRHSEKHKEMLNYLINKFKKVGVDSLKLSKDRLGYYRFTTKYYREFKYFRDRWYPDGIREIPKDLNITPDMLKYWYLGDGSYNNKSKSQNITLCNDSKVLNRHILVKELRSLGLKISVYKECFYIKRKSWNAFFNYMLVDKGIPKCYRYKFPKEVLEWL